MWLRIPSPEATDENYIVAGDYLIEVSLSVRVWVAIASLHVVVPDAPPSTALFKIDAPLYPHVGLESDGERPVLVSVHSWLTPQVMSPDGHCPDSVSWFDLESQDCWSSETRGAMILA